MAGNYQDKRKSDVWMMDDGLDNSVKEEPKNQFYAREGTYKLVTHAVYSRTNRVGYSASTGQGNTSVRVSIVTIPDHSGSCERICFNHGRELYLYVYKGIKKAMDVSKPLDKRVYKSTSPTCHDFNAFASCRDSSPLLVGFTGGQIQLLDPARKDVNKIFNDEQVVDKTRVTCVRWLPGSTHQFAVSHASGHLYIYSDELGPAPSPPVYQPHRQGDGFCVHVCKVRTAGGRNPLFRWTVGAGAINRFGFSPCGRRLAVVSQDGCLRVFLYESAELVGVARSYFGALTCVAWSPDGSYVAVGGEDDLVTVWSCCERRVAVRGRGHRSWVADVAFDPYTSVLQQSASGVDETGFARDLLASDVNYRLGSVGQDTQLCLWDLSDDVLRPPAHKNRASLALCSAGGGRLSYCAEPPSANSSTASHTSASSAPANMSFSTPSASSNGPVSSISSRLSALGFGGGGEQRREGGGRRLGGLLLGGYRGDKSGSSSRSSGSSGVAVQGGSPGSGGDPLRLMGTPSCPRLSDCPMIEPHVSCRISHERLSFVAFREDCLLTGCSDGYICSWARPGRSGSSGTPVSGSTNGTVV